MDVYCFCVRQMLDDLVIAMESEAHVADIGRVSGFMQKVRVMLTSSSPLCLN